MISVTFDGTISKEIKRVSEKFVEFFVKIQGPIGKDYWNNMRCVMYCTDAGKIAEHLKLHNTLMFTGSIDLKEDGSIYAFKVREYSFIKRPEEAKKAYAASQTPPSAEPRRAGGFQEQGAPEY